MPGHNAENLIQFTSEQRNLQLPCTVIVRDLHVNLTVLARIDHAKRRKERRVLRKMQRQSYGQMMPK